MGWKFPLTYIPDGSVTSTKLADLSVTTAKIADNAATQAKIALAAVGTDQLADLAVATGKIALLAVTTTQLANGAVATGNIADLAVVVQKLADAAVATAKIADGAVVTTKIANANITNALIANLAVGTANIQIAAITNALIANLAVGTANIQIAAITTALIADLAVTNAKITDLAADKITAGTITATIELLAATVTGGLIRTAAAGQRVEISGSTVDEILFYTGNANELAPGSAAITPTGSLVLSNPVFAAGVACSVEISAAGHINLVIGSAATLAFDFNNLTLVGAELVAIIAASIQHAVGSGGAPAFQNGWTNFGSGFGDARYTKDAQGFVHLDGLVKSGTIGTNIFTLPAGFRPAAEQVFAVITQIAGADGIGRVDVDSSGNVLAASGTNNYLSLAGITFATN